VPESKKQYHVHALNFKGCRDGGICSRPKRDKFVGKAKKEIVGNSLATSRMDQRRQILVIAVNQTQKNSDPPAKNGFALEDNETGPRRLVTLKELPMLPPPRGRGDTKKATIYLGASSFRTGEKKISPHESINKGCRSSLALGPVSEHSARVSRNSRFRI
jgi:hypothetical protein